MGDAGGSALTLVSIVEVLARDERVERRREVYVVVVGPGPAIAVAVEGEVEVIGSSRSRLIEDRLSMVIMVTFAADALAVVRS